MKGFLFVALLTVLMVYGACWLMVRYQDALPSRPPRQRPVATVTYYPPDGSLAKVFEGVEIIDSGYKGSPLMIRTADGGVIALKGDFELVYERRAQ